MIGFLYGIELEEGEVELEEEEVGKRVRVIEIRDSQMNKPVTVAMF